MKNHISAILFSLAIIITAVLFSNAFKYKYKQVETVSVTGLAEHDFTSDLIVWEGNFTRKSMNIKEAYSSLKADEQKIRSYLKEKGINDNEIVFSAINTIKDFETFYDNNGNPRSTFSGYVLSQSLEIESNNLSKIEKISREITELLDFGIEFNSTQPRYYYTKLNELKIDLLAQATADGKLRAETIANNSGSKLGQLKEASMGIFQITGKNSNEDYSWGGVFNTNSKNKTASITIRMEFQIR